ncbi:MAG: glycosyltransferase [Cyanobacteria bacterium]|nr:glycosyltransferase [Cyanobacteriota bacterium]
MRLLRITTNYPTYLNQFYTKNPELKDKTFSIQHQKITEDCFGWADFWTNSLGKIGYEVWEPVANAEAMQKMWAKEQGLQYQEKTWLTDITKAQIKFFKPDILFVDDYNSFQKDFILELKAECSSIKLVLGWCGAPYKDDSVFGSYDIVLSNIPGLVETFQLLGHQSKYFRHAFDPRILKRIDQNHDPFIDFSFIGSIALGKEAHNQRAILIKELAEKNNLEIYSDVYRLTQKDKLLLPFKGIVYDLIQTIIKDKNIRKLFQRIPKIKNYTLINSRPSLPTLLDSLIQDRAKPPLFGLDMFQGLYNSKITLNNHIDISRNSASNMRLYEATGVGTCLLTDWQENLHELFELEKEVVTYRTVEEAIEKVKYLLDHEQECKQIAKAGQARTLKDHTFAQRSVQLDAIIRQSLR